MGEISVFVLLPRNLDPSAWALGYVSGGVSDASPYGYHHAEDDHFRITFSSASPCAGAQGLAERMVRRVLGFDIVHALRNVKSIRHAQAIWTHTEVEALAVCALKAMGIIQKRTRLVAQVIWFADAWSSWGFVRRAIYKKLMQTGADVVTCLSTVNATRLSSILPCNDVRAIHFGVNPSAFPGGSRGRTSVRRFRLLSAGGDRDRDWWVLAEAIKGLGDIELVVASPTAHRAGIQTVQVDFQGMLHLYEWCDAVVVPLRPNAHASGITVVLEAADMGKPVICTDVGGMRDYFDATEVLYVKPGDVKQLRTTLMAIAREPKTGTDFAARATLKASKFTSQAYANKHKEITKELLGTLEGLRNCHEE